MADFESLFMDHRERLMQGAAGDELLQRVARGAKAEGGAAVPATNPMQDAGPPEQGSRVVRTAKDIGTGVIETPRAVIKGARDAYQSTIDMGKELGDYVESKLDLPVLMIDGQGVRITDNAGAAGHRLSDLATLPDLDAPKSVTGGIIKGVSQFIVGMRTAGKALKYVPLPETVTNSAAAMNTIKGAFANFTAFEPHQQRLSNLIQQFPALQNPVTEYLASKPDDNAAEGRFKNALEGGGLGALTDGFFKSVKMLRNVMQTKDAVQGVDESLAAAGPAAQPQLDQAAFRNIGDEADDALVSVKPKAAPASAAPTGATPTGGIEATPQDVAGAMAKPGKPESEVFINFARIDTPEDVQKAMGKIASLNQKAIGEAARGKQTFEQIKLNAMQRDAWKDLSARRMGEPLNAEQAVAARQLWASSADKLGELANAAATSPSEANLFAFRKMLAVHDTIQSQVLAARTETARALASWRIPAGGSAERMRAVLSQLDAHGGSDVSRELAQRVAALSNAGMVNELGEVVKKTAYAKTRDAMMEGWINGLLSNPATHTANSLSNASVVALRMTERRVAEAFSSVGGSQEGVAAGESAAQFSGMMDGLKDMFGYYSKRTKLFLNEDVEGFKAARAEAPAVKDGLAEASKIEHPPSISAESIGISNSGFLGRTVDALGSTVRTPGKALEAADEFYKTLGYRMEVNAQAVRQATQEANGGQLAADGFKSRVAEIVANPPENIRMAATDAALYQTFQSAPGDFARALMKIRTRFPLTKVILPFVKTPANILNFTFERTPLAPLMSRFRANMQAGGARADLALSQMAVGTSAMLLASDMAMNGKLSGRGPTDPSERAALAREGWKPYSLQVGERWYPFNRLDPVGSLLGLSGDTVEALRNAQDESVDDADAEKVAVATAIAFAGNLTNKTYLSGLSDIFEAMSDPQRYGEGTAQRLAGSVIPAGVAGTARLEDPYVREVGSMLDAIRARTPGLSEKLPARRGLWGDPISYESGFGKAFDMFSPVTTVPGKKEPIDEEILRNGAHVTMPQRKTNFDGVTVDLGKYPAAYSRYVELAGNGLKHPAWKLGAKDLLNQVVSGQHPLSAVYRLRSDGPEGGKDFFIRDTVSKYRELARTQLLKEYPDLAEEVRDKKAHARAMKMPVIR
jgi:hypothetical protein